MILSPCFARLAQCFPADVPTSSENVRSGCLLLYARRECCGSRLSCSLELSSTVHTCMYVLYLIDFKVKHTVVVVFFDKILLARVASISQRTNANQIAIDLVLNKQYDLVNIIT